MSGLGATAGLLIAMALVGCAGNPFDETTQVGSQNTEMTGRWILTAPNAPSCGMNFSGAPDAQQGAVVPEGGCPGKFYTSRQWTLEQGMLAINDDENQPLAQLTFAGDHYEGQASTGMAVTLTRQTLGPT